MWPAGTEDVRCPGNGETYRDWPISLLWDWEPPKLRRVRGGSHPFIGVNVFLTPRFINKMQDTDGNILMLPFAIFLFVLVLIIDIFIIAPLELIRKCV